MKKYIVGIDEAGRGPLAGPLCVAGVATTISKIYFPRVIKDSKKLSAKQREEWREVICKNFKYATAFISSQVIDRIGISKAARLGVACVLRKLLFQRPRGSLQVLVLLDGALFAPKKYDQQTIVKGDEKVPLIAAASIIAKTSRDAKMLQFHKKFPQYKFDAHKGYGTRQHYKMLKKHGLSSIHRHLFLRNVNVAR